MAAVISIVSRHDFTFEGHCGDQVNNASTLLAITFTVRFI